MSGCVGTRLQETMVVLDAPWRTTIQSSRNSDVTNCQEDGEPHSAPAAAEDALPPPFMAIGLDPLSYVYKI